MTNPWTNLSVDLLVYGLSVFRDPCLTSQEFCPSIFESLFSSDRQKWQNQGMENLVKEETVKNNLKGIV